MRAIHTIEMSMRDLIFKIVPTKIVKKNMHTSKDKKINKESEYLLQEVKNHIPVGKKTKIEYSYKLDLKEDTASVTEEEKVQLLKDKERKKNVFTMNLVDFNLFKLRSTLFLLQFPITFTLLIINVWKKLLPEKIATAQGYSREE